MRSCRSAVPASVASAASAASADQPGMKKESAGAAWLFTKNAGITTLPEMLASVHRTPPAAKNVATWRQLSRRPSRDERRSRGNDAAASNTPLPSFTSASKTHRLPPAPLRVRLFSDARSLMRASASRNSRRRERSPVLYALPELPGARVLAARSLLQAHTPAAVHVSP